MTTQNLIVILIPLFLYVILDLYIKYRIESLAITTFEFIILFIAVLLFEEYFYAVYSFPFIIRIFCWSYANYIIWKYWGIIKEMFD